MGSLANNRIEVVKTLIETAPDSAVRDLEEALRGQMAGDGLAAVRAMIDAEVWERNVRDAVFLPLSPLFLARADAFEQVLFPAAVLPRLWRALKQSAPTPLSIAVSSLTVGGDSDYYPPSYDQLCVYAAEGLAAEHPDFAGVIQMLENFRAGAAAQFASFLAITPLARIATGRLSGWTRNMNSENAAAVRLLFRDAAAISQDAGPCLMEVMLSHLREPWMILRFVAVVTNRANDRCVSESEMASFCQRLLRDIDRHLNTVRAFDFDNGPEAAVAAAKAVALAAAEVAEFEGNVALEKGGPWGKVLAKHKSFLAAQAENYLKKCGKLVSDALPIHPVRVGAGRGEPKLQDSPEPRLVHRAMAGLTFFDRSRAAATLGGYGAVRTKVSEQITHGLDVYMEDVLTLLREGQAGDVAIAYAYLEVVADFMGLAQGPKAAQIVRRRAAAVA